MRTYLNEITGVADAVITMYMSKRSWTRAFEEEVRSVCFRVLDKRGKISGEAAPEDLSVYHGWLQRLVKWGKIHTTMLRFIDMSVTVEGLHRAGQDDWDAHAARFNNRIIRSSTRLADFSYELSEWYASKIIPTDLALTHLGLKIPDTISVDGLLYKKAVNGYIRDDMSDDPDVKRGLYMLSIPSNFIFKVNMTEWAHVFKERNAGGNANPEVKLCCESIADQIESFQPLFNRKLFLDIKN
ncbi:MAG: hypothetical protein LBH95_02225 [Oscillospiraceae bacterium]|jgi:hypothetical protein|nr:hypothetical protein [Oscillospiraceae bacterium]